MPSCAGRFNQRGASKSPPNVTRMYNFDGKKKDYYIKLREQEFERIVDFDFKISETFVSSIEVIVNVSRLRLGFYVTSVARFADQGESRDRITFDFREFRKKRAHHERRMLFFVDISLDGLFRYLVKTVRYNSRV